MSQKNNEKFIAFLATLSSLGLIAEIKLMGWEFWVPLVIVVGLMSLWAVNLSGRVEYDIRKLFYFVYAVLLVFYHGVHKSSLFDTALVAVLAMAAYSMLNSTYMIYSHF